VANHASGNVSAYSIASSGALTALSGSPYTAGTGPYGIVVDQSGTHVYVANNGTGDVSAYNINPSNGNLSPIVGEPFPAGTGPHGVAVAPQQQ
jgi:DNA-binding beta-propeller fold protein YncE